MTLAVVIIHVSQPGSTSNRYNIPAPLALHTPLVLVPQSPLYLHDLFEHTQITPLGSELYMQAGVFRQIQQLVAARVCVTILLP